MATRYAITIRKDERTKNGWVKFTVRGGLVGQAKVADKNADYGKGRTYKLFLEHEMHVPGFGRAKREVYNFDRGSEERRNPGPAWLDDAIVDVVRQLEALPPAVQQ